MALLQTHDLEVAIAGVTVCRDLALSIDPGQCWGVLGRNGVGKTTLLHTLGGLRPPAQGVIALEGTPLSRISRRDAAQRLAILFQEYADAFPSSVLDTALIGRHPHLGMWQWEGPRDIQLARQALADMGIAALETRMTATLSGGERRRLEIAAVLTQAPRLLLLDEPTNHLDLHHQISVLDRLTRQYRPDGALMMTLHDVNLAARFCDHILLLFGDGDALWGPAEQVLTEAHLTRLYRHPIHLAWGNGRRFYFPE